MKNRLNLIIILSILISLIGCKSDTKKKSEEENHSLINKPEKPSIKNDFFELKLYIELKKNDEIELFYLEESDQLDAKFSSQKTVKTTVQGKVGIQEVKLSLSPEIYPNKIRIDFSNNIEQKEFKLDSIVISRSSEKITIDKNNFYECFSNNGNILVNDFHIFNLKLKPNNYYNPHVSSKPFLNDELMFL